MLSCLSLLFFYRRKNEREKFL
ncbi:MAG: hypothetical protein AB1757_19845 [Acidobacteriota bacterium]